MDKERREGLRRKISDHGGTARVGKKEGLRSAELLELLDMADERDQLREIRWKHLDLIGTLQDCVASTSQERDRYRALLEAYSSGAFGTHEWFMKQVNAELEGKHD